MKKGKKLLIFFSSLLVGLILFGTIISADSSNLIKDSDNFNNKENSSLSGLSENVYGYIKDFTNNTGIKPEEIRNVSQLDLNSLPKDVDLKNVKDANLAIYQIEYSLNNSSRSNQKLYMITYSTNQLQTQGDLIISEDKRSLLNFGINREIGESQFMESATGIVGSLDKGYVMMREGSITGVSTNLESLGGDGSVEILVYKNGEKINFGNEFVISQEGVKKDYDVQSKGIIEFKAGDVISLYIKVSGNVSIKDINTLLEIVTY